jgi:hypothetical protein
MDHLLGSLEESLTTKLMAPDFGGRKAGVPEGVVPMPVGVDNPGHREGGQGAQLLDELIGLAIRGTGVDNEEALLTHDNTDVEIEGREASPEDAVGQLIEHRSRLDPAGCPHHSSWPPQPAG